MVVDDSPGVLQSLVMLLHHFEFEVWGFLNGQEAVDAIKQCAPDILICDAHMDEAGVLDDTSPDRIKGIEIASVIQRAWPDCRVIIMSANLKPSIVLDHARTLGVRATVLPKPSHPASLLSKLRSRTAA